MFRNLHLAETPENSHLTVVLPALGLPVSWQSAASDATVVAMWGTSTAMSLLRALPSWRQCC